MNWGRERAVEREAVWAVEREVVWAVEREAARQVCAGR